MENFIPISKPSITQLEIDKVTDAVTSTWISSIGKYIDEFETEFAAFCDTKYAVAVANGTVAIHLALECLGVGNGDEVIMPNLSFVATANSVLYARGVPVFADIDPYNLCLDPADIERLITPKTKAIMPVHLYGHPADMREINRIAKKHNLLVIEDAAEAHGATIEGKKVGSWGDCATFSFYGNKNLTTGEGGMITTNDEKLYHKMRFLRDHGMSKEKRYWHTELGYNYRMTNLQAALGCAQMERVSEIMEKRKQVYAWYEKYLKTNDRISINKTSAWATNAYWLITLQVEGYKEEDRELLMQNLKLRGIDSRPFFYPMSQMPYINAKVETPVTDRVYKQGINLPTYFDLTEQEIKRVCEAVNSLLC